MATVATIADTTIVGDNEDQLVTMIVDDQLFGVPILQVQDIVEASKITPVPLAPSAIAGVLNLRGRIVTVVDLRKLLGNHNEVPWESQMGVTVEHKGDLYTLLVDAIGDVRTLPRHDFDKAPSTMEDNVRRLSSGIYRLRGNLLVVLDVARILHTDIIEATPMLTVAERRNRKNEAIAQSDGSSSKRHQLSALMTDLNTYESEVEGVFGATSDTSEDDIKSRKRANRHRRSVAERWQEVLEEKARRTGQSTYRMREPDEETIENARNEMADEDAEWAARIIDPEIGPTAATEEIAVSDAAADEQLPDLPASDEPAPADNLPIESGDWPRTTESGPAVPDERPASRIPDSWVDDPIVSDPAPDQSVEEPAITGSKTPLDFATPSERPDDESTAQQEDSVETKSVPEISLDDPADDSGMPWDSDSAVDVQAEHQTPESGVGAQVDTPWDAPADEPVAEIPGTTAEDGDLDRSPSTGREFSGITSGWWNKLRSRSGGGKAEPDAAGSPAQEEGAGTTKPSETGGSEVMPGPAGTPEDATSDSSSSTETAKKTSAPKKSAGKAKRASKAGGKSKTGAKSRKKT